VCDLNQKRRVVFSSTKNKNKTIEYSYICVNKFTLLNKKLHILFLCGWYPSRVLPTNGDFIQRHAEAVATKHKVTVLHIITDENLTKKKDIECTKINEIETYIGYVQKTNNPIIKLKRYVAMFFELSSKINDVQVIHVNSLFPFGLFGLYLKATKNIPYLISEHWTGYHFPQSKNSGFFQKILSKIIVKNASFVCPVSNDLASSMQQLGLKGNYCKVPNVVDTDLFTPSKNIETHFTIIHISNLSDIHKNITGMLEVAKNLEEKIGTFTWKFIGGTDENFKKKIKNLAFKTAKIEFINHISQKELVSHLQKATVFVMFSNFENLPCVILEAFSCGIPVISTNVGGISENFPENFGTLIEAKNNKQLLENLLKYHKEKNNNKDKMHTYAVNNFSKSAIEKTFSELYLKSIKK
jgi:glycosyltransferase involved in cell wall biosynthesis